MALKLITGPTIEPVGVEDVKRQARIVFDTEDHLLQNMYIPAARQSCENWCHRGFITQTWRKTLDTFPGTSGVIYLDRGPVIAVTTITYLSTAGVSTTLDSSNYRVSTDDEPCRIVPAYGYTWPTSRGDIANVAITFTVGYGSNATYVPKPIKQAICFTAAQWCKFREPIHEGTINEVPKSVEWCLADYQMRLYA